MTESMAAERAVVRGLAEYTRELCGERAIVEEFDLQDQPISVVEVKPRTAGALALSIIGEQFLAVGAGRGGRWELGYTDEDVARARQIIEALVHGRVELRVHGKRASLVIEVDDGSTERTSVTEGCSSLVIPHGIWNRRTSVRTFQAY